MTAELKQETYYRGWILLETNESNIFKKRLLLLTTFRLIIVKVSILGRVVKPSISVFHITKLFYKPGENERLHISLNASACGISSLCIQHPQSLTQIAQSLVFSLTSLQYSLPPTLVASINLPPSTMANFRLPEPDSEDRFLARYLCECDANATPICERLVLYVMSCFCQRDSELNIKNALKFVPASAPILRVHLQALACALQGSGSFTSLAAADVQLEDDGLALLSSAFAGSSRISRLSVVNCGVGRAGFLALAEALARSKHDVSYLNISNNSIGNQGTCSLYL